MEINMHMHMSYQGLLMDMLYTDDLVVPYNTNFDGKNIILVKCKWMAFILCIVL